MSPRTPPGKKGKAPALPAHLPPVTTLRQLLALHCDLRATAPKKAFLLVLSEFTTRPDEKHQLRLPRGSVGVVPKRPWRNIDTDFTNWRSWVKPNRIW